MPLLRKAHTRQLSEGAYVLSVRRQYRWLGVLALIIVLLTATGFGVLQYYHSQYAPASRIEELKQENAKLRVEIERLRLALKMDNSAHAALEQQVAILNEQLVQVQSELEFFRAQGAQRLGD